MFGTADKEYMYLRGMISADARNGLCILLHPVKCEYNRGMLYFMLTNVPFTSFGKRNHQLYCLEFCRKICIQRKSDFRLTL